MQRCQIPKHFLPWLQSLLTNREVTTEINGIKQTRVLNCGTPQGGVWSPKLWNAAINFILDQENNHGVTCVGFADDMALTMTGPDLNVLFETLAKRTKIIKRKIAQLGLSLNTSKTEVVLFTRKRPKELPSFRVDNTTIPVAKSARYLGVILDSQLTFMEHIKQAIAKTKKSIFMLRNFVYKKYGPSPKLMRLCYTVVARTKLSYASHIWQHRKGHHKSLRQCQRLALLTMAPTGRSMPTNGLEVIWNIPPINLHLQNVALATYGRIQGKTPHTHQGTPDLRGHLDILRNTFEKLGLTKASDRVTRRAKAQNYTVLIEKNPDTKEDPDYIQVYTDGSKIEGFAGCGYFMQDKLKVIQACEHLGKEATVFQGEILAIQRGAEKLQGTKGKKIVFISDSQASLLALSKNKYTSKSAWECHQALNSLALDNLVELKWTKAHVGTFGNERADQLAKSGSLKKPEENITLTEYQPPISLAEIKTKIKDHILSKWQKQWDNGQDSLHTWRMIPKVNSNIGKTITGLTRDQAKYFLQMLTGHCQYRKHRWVILGKKKYFDPTCPYCGRDSKLDDTPAHALKECDRWIPERSQAFNEDKVQHVEDYRRLWAFFGSTGLRNHSTTHLTKLSSCHSTVGVSCVLKNKVK